MHIRENNVQCFPPESMMPRINKSASLDFLLAHHHGCIKLPFNNFNMTRDRLCQESNQVKNNREICFQKIIINKLCRHSKISRSSPWWDMIAVSKLFKSIPNELGSMINSIPKIKSGDICLLFRSYNMHKIEDNKKINPLPCNWSKLHSKLQYGRKNRCFDQQSSCFDLVS